jgi:nicotinamide mononucleotide transporter
MTLAELLAPLNAPLFKLGNAAVSTTEAFGFVSGALCVWLVAKQHIWNWPIGIANNALFLLLFATSGLYADAGLQVLYIVLAIYGWWSWLFGGQDHASLRVSNTDRRTAMALGVSIVLGTIALYLLLHRVTDSTVPFWDGLTTSLSLAATYGQTRKQLESWWLWMAADVIYVPMYAYKGLWLTSVLYVGFFLLCLNGYLSWKRSLAPASAPAELAA